MAVGEGAGADGLGPGARSKVPGRKSKIGQCVQRSRGGRRRAIGGGFCRPLPGLGKEGGEPRVDTRG